VIPAPFSVAQSLALADDILSRPPTKPGIARPEVELMWSIRVFRVAIPSELCLAGNDAMRTHWAARGRNEAKIWKWLAPQALKWRAHNGDQWPFSPFKTDIGIIRPQVFATKFSARGRPDKGANFAKAVIDMLTEGISTQRKHRIGVITNDDEQSVEQVLPWWEFLPAKHHAFVVVEVRIS
jgi:hypothetical protein